MSHSASTSSPISSVRRGDAGFTLVELLVVIVVVSVVIGLLLPAVNSARESRAADAGTATIGQISLSASGQTRETGRAPRSLGEHAAWCRGDGQRICEEFGVDEDILDGTDAGYYLIIRRYAESRAFFEQLLLDNGLPVPDPAPEIVIIGEPAIPGPATEMLYQIGEVLVAAPAPGAAEAQKEAFAEILRAWVLEIGGYARISGIDLVSLIRGDEFPETREVIGNFDLDFDGLIDGNELFSGAWIDQSSDEFAGGLGTRLLEVVRCKLGIGAAGEDPGAWALATSDFIDESWVGAIRYAVLATVAGASGDSPQAQSVLANLAQSAEAAQDAGDTAQEDIEVIKLKRLIDYGRARFFTDLEADGMQFVIDTARTSSPTDQTQEATR